MRRLLLATVMWAMVTGAHAADLPFLRGSFTDGLSYTRTNWDGVYFGGQAGYGSSDENFNGANTSILQNLISDNVIQQMGVANWTLGLGKVSQQAPGYGAFAGYNSQWDDVVIGIEASYLHGSFGGSSSAFKQLVSGSPLSDGFYHNVAVTSSDSIEITDMATLRARAGYAIGRFLPYMFGGLALGNADITRAVTVQDAVATSALGPYTSLATLYGTEAQHNHLIYGYTGGVGVDVNLMDGLFMRAEWEYVRFTASVDTSINTVRLGLGYKF